MTLPILADGQQWHVAYTQPKGEVRAIRHLMNQEFSVYLPRYMKRMRIGRREVRAAAPLFPRYIFVGVDTARQRWRSINSTVGISHLVCQGDAPASLDATVLEAISRQEDENGIVSLPAMPKFSPGQSVRITNGMFADQLGLYEGLRDQERVCILLDLLGRKVRVMIESDIVVAN